MAAPSKSMSAVRAMLEILRADSKGQVDSDLTERLELAYQFIDATLRGDVPREVIDFDDARVFMRYYIDPHFMRRFPKIRLVFDRLLRAFTFPDGGDTSDVGGDAKHPVPNYSNKVKFLDSIAYMRDSDKKAASEGKKGDGYLRRLVYIPTPQCQMNAAIKSFFGVLPDVKEGYDSSMTPIIVLGSIVAAILLYAAYNAFVKRREKRAVV
jgi:hypothetical protein